MESHHDCPNTTDMDPLRATQSFDDTGGSGVNENVAKHEGENQAVSNADSTLMEDSFAFDAELNGAGIDDGQNRTSTPVAVASVTAPVDPVSLTTNTPNVADSNTNCLPGTSAEGANNFSTETVLAPFQVPTEGETQTQGFETERVIFLEESSAQPTLQETSSEASSTLYASAMSGSSAFVTASEGNSTFVGSPDQTDELSRDDSNNDFFEESGMGEVTEQDGRSCDGTETQNPAFESSEETGENSFQSSATVASAEYLTSEGSSYMQPFLSVHSSSVAQLKAAACEEGVTKADDFSGLAATSENNPTTGIEEENHENSVKPCSKDVADKSNLDLRLLETICEEATSMTIKEALIHSLNPTVRAGLQDGKFTLNETEVLALEQYCETVVNDLITELLESCLTPEDECSGHAKEIKQEKASQLSELGLQALKENCERFAHDIIAESVRDSNNFLSTSKARAREPRDFQAPLHSDAMQELMIVFQDSEDIQCYIGDLTAGIISSALNNVAVSISTKNVGKDGLEEVEAGIIEVPSDEDTSEVEFGSGMDGVDDLDEEEGVHRGTWDLNGEVQLEDFETESLNSTARNHSADLVHSYGGIEATLEYDAEWDKGDILREFQSFAPG